MDPFKAALANWAFYKYANDGALNISEAGITQFDEGMGKSAYQWQILNFKKERVNNACPSMFEVHKYLEANLPTYTAYRDCDERSLAFGVPIRGYAYFNNYQSVDGFCTYIALRSEIGKSANALGCIITDTLLSEITAAVLARSFNADLLALIPYVESYVAAATIKRALINKPVSITARGVFVSELDSTSRNDTKETVNGHLIGKRSREVENELLNATNRLTNFLDKNASASKYTSYYNDVVVPNADVSTDQSDLSTFRM